MATKKWSELSAKQKKAIQAIMDEQEEEDIELGDPDVPDDETVVGVKGSGNRRLLVIEGPDVDRILRQLGIDEEDVEDDDDDSENENEEIPPAPPKSKTSRKEKAKEIDDETPNDPPPPPRSRWFGDK
jgi:hypothetical protein